MYKAILDKLGLGVTDIQACTTTLYGFSGEGVACIGAVSLVVTFEEYPLSVTKMMEFMVVNTPSVYNAILGRPMLVGLGAIASMRHLAIKFPTSKGIGIIRGNQLAAREYYVVSTHGKGDTTAQSLILAADAEKADVKVGTKEGAAAQTLVLVANVKKADAKAGIREGTTAKTLVLIVDAQKADAKAGIEEGEAIQTLVLVIDDEKADAKSGIGEVEATQTFVLVPDAEKADTKAGTGEVVDFDPRVGDEMADIQQVGDLDVIYLDPNNQSKIVRIGKGLIEESRCQLT